MTRLCRQDPNHRNLRAAELFVARLVGADLSCANLRGAFLHEVDLTDVKDLGVDWTYANADEVRPTAPEHILRFIL